MSTLPIPITLVRWTDRDAARLLEGFINGGDYIGHRAPRGIDPVFVSWWIRERVRPDASPLAFAHVRDLLRFYERADVLDHLGRMLTRNESDDSGYRRSSYIAQAIGDVGTFEQTRFAAGYFHEFLLPLRYTMTLFALTLETAEALASAVDIGAVGRRLQRELAVAGQVKDLRGPEGLPYRKYSDYNRNNLPATVRVVEAKQRLIASDPAQRLQELLVIYLGESDLSSPSMEIWSGRLLRAYAMKSDEGKAAVLAAFGQVMNAAQKSQMAKPKKEFIVHRCAQAIVYLGGKLTFPEEEVYEAIEDGPENFLWDDPGAPSVRV